MTVLDMSQMPDPDKLRDIVWFLDKTAPIFVNVWATSSDPRKEEALEFYRGREMQEDLERWADYIERLPEWADYVADLTETCHG